MPSGPSMSQQLVGHVTPADSALTTTNHRMSDPQPGPSRAPAAQVPSAAAVKAAKRTGNSIIVNKRQKGNPILEHVRNVPWEYGDILADYQVGATTGVMYLSLKYHHLHPQYIFTRFEKLGRNYDLRVLLVLCDVTEHQNSIKELTKASLLNQITVMVAWSPEEAGQYLATYKLYEFKSHQLIKERVDADYSSVLRAALTTVRGVNKTDVMTLRTNFGSFKNIVHATTEDLQLCPGLGPTKVRRLREAFNKPFHSSGQKPSALPGPHERTQPEQGEQPDEATPEISMNQDAALTFQIDPPPFHPTTRHSSPEWDLDLPEPHPRPDANLDLELELNPSDDESRADVETHANPDMSMENVQEDASPLLKKRRANE